MTAADRQSKQTQRATLALRALKRALKQEAGQ